MKWILLLMLSVPGALAEDLKIAGWRNVDGVSEAEAARLTVAAIRNFLTVDEDGQVCGVDEVWGLERDRDLIPDFPERGELFAVTGYAVGPDPKCERMENYDCRVVFNRPPGAELWSVEHVACDTTYAQPNE